MQGGQMTRTPSCSEYTDNFLRVPKKWPSGNRFKLEVSALLSFIEVYWYYLTFQKSTSVVSMNHMYLKNGIKKEVTFDSER